MRDYEVKSPADRKLLTTGSQSTVPNEAAVFEGRVGPAWTSHALLQFQRKYGNRYVRRMLAPDAPSDLWKTEPQQEADLKRGNGFADTSRDAPAPPAHQLVQRETADGAGGKAAPAEPTEHLAGALWAVDENGKALPPSLDDISQGGVNDCFLFAAMAAIVSSNPQRIVDMIRDNGNGTYTVTFRGIGFFSSAEQTVSADFTVGQRGNVTGRKALWPLIIEKAYAQQKGGLGALGKGGNAGSALDEMLDEGPSRFDPRDKPADYTMGKLAKAKEKKWPMTILSPKQDGATQDKKTLAENTPGLHFWHTYAITDVDATGNRIKLFNPWGHDHPNGDGWMKIDQVRTFFIEIDING